MLVKQMIFRAFCVLAIMITSVNFASAQDEISDEELTKYVTVMDEIDAMKKAFNTKLNDMVKNNDDLSTKRYNEIKDGKGAAPSEEEKKAYDAIVAEIEKETKNIQDKSQDLIKDKEKLGAMTYNKVRKALKTAQKADLEKRMTAIREKKGTAEE